MDHYGRKRTGIELVNRSGLLLPVTPRMAKEADRQDFISSFRLFFMHAGELFQSLLAI